MDEKYFMSISNNYCYENMSDRYRTTHEGVPFCGEKTNNIVTYCPISNDVIKNTSKNFEKEFTKIISFIVKLKLGKTKKYMTQGYKQAKQIKKYCDENNISCEIEEDQNIKKNKLKSIKLLHDPTGNTYNSECRDYAGEHIIFCKEKCNVIYVKIKK
jgi:hypothetical protein